MDISERDGSIVFTIRVVPRASKTQIAGEFGGAVKVRVASPPVDGAANAELIRFFAKLFDVARSDVEMVSGHTSRTKQLKLYGVTADRLRSAVDLSGRKSA